MNVKILVACLAVGLGAVAFAEAQVGAFTLDWQVNGSNTAIVNPGDIVTVTGIASWTPTGAGLGGAIYRLDLNNANATDTLQYTESLGLGRNPVLRFTPQTLTDSAFAGGRSITAAGGAAIDSAQAMQMINPGFSSANPIQVFRFMFVAGAGGRTIDIGGSVVGVTVYANAMGQPAGVYTPSVDGAQIQIVPAPGSLALLGVGGLVAMRRRRNR